MNRRMILSLLCIIMRLEAVFMLPPLVISIHQQEHDAVTAFLLTIVVMLFSSMTTYLLPPSNKIIYAREGLLTVAMAWIMVSIFGAFPFFLSGEIPNFVDCLFETVSGFTTTGASILSDVESLSMGLLYWRSFTHWLGGMGVLVFLLAIAPLAKGKGSFMYLLRAESPGPEVDKLVPKLHKSAALLYAIYVVMTLIQIFLLLAGGMPLFDSVTTAFGTAGTGGFSIKNDSMIGYTLYQQAVVTIFMALFGVNFNIYYLLLMKKFRKAFLSQELRAYFGIMLGDIFLMTWNVLTMFGGNLGQALHHVSFQVSSVMTTTGFCTQDFDLWPEFSRTILVILMIVGACAGSTGGGIKIARVVLIFKSAVSTFRRMLRPRSVSVIQIDGHTVEKDTINSMYSFLIIYSVVAIFSILLISLDNLSFETNVTAVLACLNNIGPGLDVVGPVGNYSSFSNFSKLVLSFTMLVGRLEIFPMLILFLPSAWKR